MGEVGTSIGMDARRNGLPEELDRAGHHHQGEEPVWVISPPVILPEKSSLSAFFQSVNNLFL
jgi:hypothetical protein